MEQISKKELLDLTDISYGQLYRWKRKGLIPEEWFIRKSTFTGQETFFPKEEILARVEKIKNMKDDLSLEDMAEKFSPMPAEVRLSSADLVDRKIASQSVLDLFLKGRKEQTSFSFEETFALYTMNNLLQSGALTLEEVESAIKLLTEHYPKSEGRVSELIVVRKLGVAASLLVSTASPVFFDETVKIVYRANLSASVEALKMLL